VKFPKVFPSRNAPPRRSAPPSKNMRSVLGGPVRQIVTHFPTASRPVPRPPGGYGCKSPCPKVSQGGIPHHIVQAQPLFFA
jgi:hypothetical protein